MKIDLQDSWGLSSSIDLSGCDPDIIRDAEKLKQYARELCDLIEMKRFGETVVVNFGEDEKVKGYSLVQLLYTSALVGHFADISNTAFIDVFSCKSYDPELAAEFTKNFFKAEKFSLKFSLRNA
jgi:S-adenosylmethionine/arginine decarboxylase-like enzyme